MPVQAAFNFILWMCFLIKAQINFQHCTDDWQSNNLRMCYSKDCLTMLCLHSSTWGSVIAKCCAHSRLPFGTWEPHFIWLCDHECGTQQDLATSYAAHCKQWTGSALAQRKCQNMPSTSKSLAMWFTFWLQPKSTCTALNHLNYHKMASIASTPRSQTSQPLHF